MSVLIIQSPEGAPLTIARPQGGALIDVCDETNAPIPFSCRGANCGTCRIVVLEGGDDLTEPEDEELDVLDAFGHKAPPYRLACCAKLRAGTKVVRIRPVADDE